MQKICLTRPYSSKRIRLFSSLAKRPRRRAALGSRIHTSSRSIQRLRKIFANLMLNTVSLLLSQSSQSFEENKNSSGAGMSSKESSAEDYDVLDCGKPVQKTTFDELMGE